MKRPEVVFAAILMRGERVTPHLGLAAVLVVAGGVLIGARG